MDLTINNPNYVATVISVENINVLDNCDNVVWIPIYWFQAIVGKDTKIGDKLLLFTTESQLSEDFAYNNNLYSSQLKNKDTTKKGYMWNNARVRAVKFRGQTSNALLMPLSSLAYLWINYNQLNVWDTFDTINWVQICKKYEIIVENWRNKVEWKNQVFERFDAKLFPQHFATEHYFKNEYKIADNATIIVTQKLHWTSSRFWLIKVKQNRTLLDRLLFRTRTEYELVVWSRRIIKNWQKWFYSNDIWTEIALLHKNSIPKDCVVYWEIIWYDWEKSIQKDYTYNLNKWEKEIYVYRIVSINEDWFAVDWSWEAIKEFCKNTWLKYVPELFICKKWEANINNLMDVVYANTYNQCVPLSNKDTVDEWVCVRVEGLQPYILKAKSPKFLEHETKELDEGVLDVESNS